MEPYAKDFRSEVLAACDAGEGTRAVATRFKVSASWVRRVKQQRRETGQTEAKLAKPRRPTGHDWADRLRGAIADSPDVYSRFRKLLRDGAERTVNSLWKLCGIALDQSEKAECRNYFKHGGYRYN